jgi:hypothetical protein
MLKASIKEVYLPAMNLHFDPHNFKSTTLVLFLNFMIPFAPTKKKKKIFVVKNKF